MVGWWPPGRAGPSARHVGAAGQLAFEHGAAVGVGAGLQGTAPEALEELPAPDQVFIGGSSGNMRQILELLLQKNPQVRIVINCIALETVAETLNCIKELAVTDTEIVQLSVSKAKEIGSYHMMMGENPIYIISCTGNGKGR